MTLSAKNRSHDEHKPQRFLSDRTLSGLFLFPSVLAIMLIVIYPMCTGLLYSLKDGTMFESGHFIGPGNFLRLLRMHEFWNALRFSAAFALVSVIGSYLMGLSIALLLNMDVPFRGFFRAAILLPWIIPSIVSIVAWRWLLGDQQSFVNVLLSGIGVEPVLFLAHPTWAFVSLCIVKIWRSFPFMMVSLLAVLQTIPAEQYEAAQIDGAGPMQKFYYVTWPHLLSITVVCGILMTIWSVNDFDTIYLLTNGGPFDSTQNLIVMAYKHAFTKNDIGLGSAIAIIAMIVLMCLANLSLTKQRRTET